MKLVAFWYKPVIHFELGFIEYTWPQALSSTCILDNPHFQELLQNNRAQAIALVHNELTNIDSAAATERSKYFELGAAAQVFIDLKYLFHC